MYKHEARLITKGTLHPLVDPPLWGVSLVGSKKKYITSITKTKAARYELVAIEDMIPNLWSATKVGYEKDVAFEIKHWGPKRQQIYKAQLNRFSKHNVYSPLKILSVVSVMVDKLHGYGYLEEIMVRRADRKLYKFKEGDFVNLQLNDIEDMLLLVVQYKLFHLNGEAIIDLAITLCAARTGRPWVNAKSKIKTEYPTVQYASWTLRYVDGSLPSEAIGHAGRGSLHSKGTGQMSHSKVATLLTFVTVEAPSVTLYIKHKYKLELRCSKANSLLLGDQESKQLSEHHDDTSDKEVLCLFTATPDFPKSVICNVDGVTPKFLEIGEQMSVVKEVVEQKFPAFCPRQSLGNDCVDTIKGCDGFKEAQVRIEGQD
ncbi:hypothetical protein Tco_0152959 [Tanacetum coccineum]